MHTLIDVKNNIPNFILLTPGNVHDCQVMDDLPIEASAYYLMDKGYVDFDRLFRLFQQQKAYFVTRAKDNIKYTVFEAREVDKQTDVIFENSSVLQAFSLPRNTLICCAWSFMKTLHRT